MKIQIEDNDLKELILTGTNNKYIQLARDQRFMTALGRLPIAGSCGEYEWLETV